ncbi:MAG: hypothetical protein M9892_03240 [Bacteroidetes bacterium]|nr:hypothetical protein [Bacteroidota bacterium]
MAGLMDIKNNMPPLKKKNGITHSTNVLQFVLFLIVLVLIVFFFSGCKPQKAIIERETHYKETFKDTTIYLPGEVVTQPLSADFLKQLENRFKSNLKDTVRIVSRTGETALKYYKDQFGQLITECEAKDKQIDLLLKTIERFEVKSEVKVKTERVMAWWAWLIVAVNIGLLFNLVIIKIFRK